ncbi:MAG: UDP-N-acetylmuramate--L-alanine ligase [Lachnospiraceae bacterium]|nr:UDP-N-acetylmuramate--L-alanine ligase [Lachnospiraceae bacterium]
MGICGSGCASIAMLAYEAGYRVSGCDRSSDSYYGEALLKLGIPIYTGHDAAHLTDDVDIVAVTPALFDICPDHPELLEASRRGILMTWQEFMGRYLQQGKRVIAVSGTHGKTTTTFLTAELMIEAGLDPTVEGGSVYKKWNSGGRAGHSDWFLCEADEFNRNFHHYKPEIAVVNNVEMDHPECYRDFEEVLESFRYFLAADPYLKTVLLNADSEGALEVLKRVAGTRDMEGVSVVLLSKDRAVSPDIPGIRFRNAVWRTVSKQAGGTVFELEADGKTERFSMLLCGEYNVFNAAMSVLTAREAGGGDEAIRTALTHFAGAGRRFDCVGTLDGVPVYDDYAHHPTEISSVLTMCKEYFPERKVLAVFEPHQISRLTLMFDAYVDALTIADHVIIGKTFIGREVRSNTVPIGGAQWMEASEKITYEEAPERILAIAESLIREGECGIILVIGAANSYKLSRYLCSRGDHA